MIHTEVGNPRRTFKPWLRLTLFITNLHVPFSIKWFFMSFPWKYPRFFFYAYENKDQPPDKE